MSDNTKQMTPEEARSTLESIDTMGQAGWQSAVPPRWVSAGYAIIAGGTCATFAMDNLQNTYFYWWGLAYIIFIGYVTKSVGAIQREFHPPKDRRLAYWGSTVGMLIMGFGSIALRYSYDAGWIALVGGIANGIWMYLYYEGQRRYTDTSAKAGL